VQTLAYDLGPNRCHTLGRGVASRSEEQVGKYTAGKCALSCLNTLAVRVRMCPNVARRVHRGCGAPEWIAG
jgi:hypothetical protein